MKVAVVGRKGCNMTPVFFFFFFLFSLSGAFLIFHIVAYKYEARSKYINKTETKLKQRPTIRSKDQVSWPFTIENGVLYAPIVRCSLTGWNREIILRDGRFLCGEVSVAIRVNACTISGIKTTESGFCRRETLIISEGDITLLRSLL